ncbi:DUF547 domain-containing protein [Flavobacterium aquidurense]|uniref:DUF547 domain-containing protein n=1 Tax=Flavobacterium aquidurense TaxID=362413 RepID=UPI00375754B7
MNLLNPEIRLVFVTFQIQIIKKNSMENTANILFHAGKLLLDVKLNLDTVLEEQKLKIVSLTDLQKELISDDAKKTFWINIYNAYFQILSKQKGNSKKIFTEKDIIIANTQFSLDDIEHGILRKHSWKWSFGYLPNPFSPQLIRHLAVKKIDYRIHFALNCGAKSCPPIAFYTLEKIENQLEDAMFSFITSETLIDMNNKTISTSKLLHWYRGDFGGTTGIKKVLQQVLELQLETYTLSFNDYNWETHIENFIEEKNSIEHINN